MEEGQKELVLKSARISYLGNYIIALLTIVFLVLLYFQFGMTFSLTPKTQSELISTLILLGIAGIASFMIEQPEWDRLRHYFIITMNEVIKHEGIINKHKVILPYATVADISVKKNFLGRILDYGDLTVSSFKTGSDMMMKGVRSPEKYYTMIQNRVNLIREGQLQMFGKKGQRDEEEPAESREELEDRKKELEDMIEETKQSFYNREIDEKQFESTIQKFQQEIIEIDVKLKKK
ncbi:MAG: PH domain-containing protein [Candidatus Aenigmarchaeota archaeon]|nr:PH domain-containing protein [Candidatus Aenigmarchaeota archaeon]